MGTVKHMDLDALTAARREEWARLDELSRVAPPHGRGGRRARHAVPRGIRRPRRRRRRRRDAASHGDHVSTMLGRARLRLTGAPENVLRQIPRFFALQLPAALYRVRWTTLVIAARLHRRRRRRRAVGLGRPGAGREPRQRGAARAVRRERVHRVLQREPRGGVRRHGLDEQRLDRRAVRAVRHHRASGRSWCSCRTRSASAPRRRS